MNKKVQNSRNWNQLTNKIYDHQRRENIILKTKDLTRKYMRQGK